MFDVMHVSVNNHNAVPLLLHCKHSSAYANMLQEGKSKHKKGDAKHKKGNAKHRKGDAKHRRATPVTRKAEKATTGRQAQHSIEQGMKVSRKAVFLLPTGSWQRPQREAKARRARPRRTKARRGRRETKGRARRRARRRKMMGRALRRRSYRLWGSTSIWI